MSFFQLCQKCFTKAEFDSFPDLGVIGSVQLDGSGYREVKAGAGLAAVALSDDTLLWMTATGNDVIA